MSIRQFVVCDVCCEEGICLKDDNFFEIVITEKSCGSERVVQYGGHICRACSLNDWIKRVEKIQKLKDQQCVT